MMPKHTIQNLAVAIIVPTILFAIALLGTRHINMPQAAVGSKFSQDSVTYLQQILEANVALKPYLKFDSVQNVCDSAVTAYHKRKGHPRRNALLLYHTITVRLVLLNIPEIVSCISYDISICIQLTQCQCTTAQTLLAFCIEEGDLRSVSRTKYSR